MFYRDIIKANDLNCYKIHQKESNIFVCTKGKFKSKAKLYLDEARNQIETYIKTYPHFGVSFKPIKVDTAAPSLIRSMQGASISTNTGPMASVAGAVSFYVGQRLLKFSDEVIVENGGDIFLKSLKERIVLIYAGKSPLNKRIALKVPISSKPYGICTSSGTLGHSFSFGKADAVVIISHDSILSDAWATRIANMIKKESDIKRGINLLKKQSKILGGLIIKGRKLAIAGKIPIKSI